MVPVPYSPLITSTPRIPIVNCPKKAPARLVPVGSKLNRLPKDIDDQWARVSAVANAPMPMPTTIVRPSVHIVDRMDRSFVHSDRSSPDMPYRPGGRTLPAPAGVIVETLTLLPASHSCWWPVLRGTRCSPR